MFLLISSAGRFQKADILLHLKSVFGFQGLPLSPFLHLNWNVKMLFLYGNYKALAVLSKNKTGIGLAQVPEMECETNSNDNILRIKSAYKNHFVQECTIATEDRFKMFPSSLNHIQMYIHYI